MKTTQKLTGAALAMAAAGLLMSATVTTVSAAEGKTVHCEGVNACKGHNDCKSAKNACKGLGECKGTGHVDMSKELTSAGMTVSRKPRADIQDRIKSGGRLDLKEAERAATTRSRPARPPDGATFSACTRAPSSSFPWALHRNP